MTKKQRKEIAIMWSAMLMAYAGTDSFDSETDPEDADAIVEECQVIGQKLLRSRPFLMSLDEIMDYVLENK